MITTIFLAQLLGIVLLIKGLFVLLRPDLVKEMVREVTKYQVFVYTAGMIAVVFGLVIVMLHNNWGSLVQALVSAIGWLSLLKGIVGGVCAEALVNLADPIIKDESDMRGVAIIVLLVAVYLLYMGLSL